MNRDLVCLCTKSLIPLLVSLCLMVLATFEQHFSRPVYLSTANHYLSIQVSSNEENVSNKDSNTTFIKKIWCDCDVKCDASAKLLFS